MKGASMNEKKPQKNNKIKPQKHLHQNILKQKKISHRKIFMTLFH